LVVGTDCLESKFAGKLVSSSAETMEAATVPSAAGFRNIKPMTRHERRALKDKVALEKDRLMKRSGLSAKLYRENAPQDSMGLTCPEPQAAGFLADADRFHTDTSGEEFLARKAKHEEKQLQYDQKRVSRVEREEARWQAIEEKKAEEEKYWDDQRESGAKAMKNNSCVPYDAITLRYNDGLDGDRLRYDDEKVRYRAALRSQNLMRCGDTRTGYNIISGHSRPNVDVPDAPEPSDSLAVHMEEEAIRAEQEEGEDFPSARLDDPAHAPHLAEPRLDG
jgi:hypothetical protein